MDGHQDNWAIDMSKLDISTHLLQEEHDPENKEDKNTSNTSIEFCNSNNCRTYKDTMSTLSMCSDTIIEKIEDNRLTFPENSNLRKRNAYSENDISFAGTINKSMTKMKEQLEHELKKKICKECLFRSIQSKLSMLGIVSTSNRNICVSEGEDEHLHDANKETKDKEDENSNRTPAALLENLNRRTLSEIDWHELTRFAQGDMFDPESNTAKEIKRVIEEGKDELTTAFKMMQNIDLDYVVEEAEKCVQCIISSGWRVVSHWELPHWMRDNDYLWHMHRPQLPSFKECFGSMFRIHTETGNIWTHFLGLIVVVIAMLFVYLSPSTSIGDFPKGWEEYLVFTAFFIGATLCLAFSWLFHTCSCHSKKTSRLFSKLDYTGIACMIMGSFVPCMYYGFYCHYYEKLAYSLCITILGLSCIIVSLWDKFATPAFRAVRAGTFLALGCSGIVPIIHMLYIHGIRDGSEQSSLGWLILMAICYILGALLYALRIPERFFPGRCNLIFQSHQIFHILVVIAALIHLHGCCQMALYRIKVGRTCPANHV